MSYDNDELRWLHKLNILTEAAATEMSDEELDALLSFFTHSYTTARPSKTTGEQVRTEITHENSDRFVDVYPLSYHTPEEISKIGQDLAAYLNKHTNAQYEVLTYNKNGARLSAP